MDIDVAKVGGDAAAKTFGAHRVFLSDAGIDSEAAFQLARRL